MGESLISNNSNFIDGLVLTPLKVISVLGGDVMHGLKSSDLSYQGFGEAYFSMVELGAIKAWKKHYKMTLNLVVPVGEVRFVIYDDRKNSKSFGKFQEITISKNNYSRLTIPPKLWLGFQGISEKTSVLLNIADFEHDPDEIERKDLNSINFNWRKD
jgi:dTDP-4-dehydrorhamnose 3,5-epimerase